MFILILKIFKLLYQFPSMSKNFKLISLNLHNCIRLNYTIKFISQKGIIDWRDTDACAIPSKPEQRRHMVNQDHSARRLVTGFPIAVEVFFAIGSKH
jgi:hypothetical protein